MRSANVSWRARGQLGDKECLSCAGFVDRSPNPHETPRYG